MKLEPIKHQSSFFASCPQGLEELLLQEVETLEVRSAQLTRGGVEFEAYNEKVLELILNSRIASRVFKKYYTLQIKDEKELSLALREIKWKAIFSGNLYFKVMCHVAGDSRDLPRAFQNTLYLSQLTKDAVVDRFLKDDHVRPSVDTKNPDVTIYLHFSVSQSHHEKSIKVEVLVDLCGAPISDRGLRPLGRHADAPMRENLAAAIVKFSNWDPTTERFVDLMCGSGTVLAEAYMLAKNIPPSLLRVKLYLATQDYIWAFQHLWWFQKDPYLMKNFELLLQKIHNRCEPYFNHNSTKKLAALPKPMLGMDIDPYAVEWTAKLQESLMAEQDMELIQDDATQYSTGGDKQLLFCNPPYGLRLQSDEAELEDLYHHLGEQWKHEAKGSRAFIFTANLPLLKRISLRPSNKWNLFNGQLPARLVEYDLF